MLSKIFFHIPKKWFLKLSNKSKVIVVILVFLFFNPFVQEENQETTTSTNIQETTSSQCIEWDKATKSNNLKMADLLKIYVDQTENYISNVISFEEYLIALDELINESRELIDLQRNTIPNKENEAADDFVQGAFAAYNQGFYSYKTGQEENDSFWINEGNEYLDFGTFNINEYYKTVKDC